MGIHGYKNRVYMLQIKYLEEKKTDIVGYKAGKCHYLHGEVVTTVRHVNPQSRPPQWHRIILQVRTMHVCYL